MKIKRILLALVAAVGVAAADYDPTAPVKVELQLIYVFEGAKTEYLFVTGSVGYKTVEKLKDYLTTLPKGSEVRWAPGCERFGNEPLLSDEKDMKAFRAFLESKGLKFTLVPAG